MRVCDDCVSLMTGWYNLWIGLFLDGLINLLVDSLTNEDGMKRFASDNQLR